MVNSEYDWQFELDSSNRFGLAYNTSSIAAGKMLGGTSSINNMVYLRGNPGDYESWADTVGPEWSYDKILPYFLKSENNTHTPYVKRKRNKFHSSQGPNLVDFFQSGDTSTQAFKDGLKELGYLMVDDINAKEHTGYAFAQGFVHKGVRQSTAKSFLVPVKDRPNLHVIKKSLVTQILFTDDDDDLQVTGVKLYIGGKKFIAKATKEVILSAGAIQTPHLLMLSGVGPIKNIRKFLRVRQNLPVGDNMQDHVSVPLFVKFNRTTSLPVQDIVDNYYNYLTGRIGHLGSIGSYDFMAFINTTDGKAKYPNVQFRHDTFITNDVKMEALLNTLNLKEEIRSQVLNMGLQHDSAAIEVVLLKPQSRGKVRIQSNIPVEKPKVIAGHLSSKLDMDTLLEGVRVYLKVLETKALQSAGIELVRLELDICDDFEFNSDAYWECYIMHFARGANNVVGTARMGSAADKKAVVDSKLRVKGVEGLRVIDASVIPNIISSGTQAVTMMIAEKGSDFIKEKWNTKLEL